MRKLLISLLLLAICFTLFAKTTSADSCQPIYGGGQTCVQNGNLIVNKQVLNPETNEYVENLGFNDPKYSSNMLVNFKIVISNTGNATIPKVDIKDILPQYVKFSAGIGSFDANSKTYTFTVNNLNAGEQRTYVLTGQIAANEELPSDKAVVCVVNQISATSDKQISTDNAEFCVEKSIAGVTTKGGLTTTGETTTKGGLKVFQPVKAATTPPTGPEMLPLIGLIPSGLIGLFLRKKAEK